MTTDRTEQLIVDLAADMTPVNRLPALSARVASWLALAVAASAAAAWIIGFRADFRRAIAEPAVVWSLGLAILASVSASIVAMRLSVPGAQPSRWTRWLPMLAMAAWAGMLIRAAQDAGVSVATLVHEPFHAACVGRVVAVAIIPTALLIRTVRRGFALDGPSAVALAVLGGAALSAATVQLVCPIDHPQHLLVSHLVPALGLVIAGAVAARMSPFISQRQ